MSKSEYRAEKRLTPIGKDGIERCRKIVAEHQCAKINEVMIDGYSASAIVQVYDGINEANRTKLESLPVHRVASICFQMMK